MDVELFFDPACTRSWVASRWLVEVAPRRGLRLYWRSFSMLIGLGTEGLHDWDLTSRTASHRALRVIEAVRVDHPEAISRLYRPRPPVRRRSSSGTRSSGWQAFRAGSRSPVPARTGRR